MLKQFQRAADSQTGIQDDAIIAMFS